MLGGGWFLGRAVAQAALDRGWEVTVFNRGRSGAAPEGVRTVRGDRTVATDLARLAGEGPWDAVVDTSASEMAPRDVLAGAHALEPVAGRYVYVSTVNAYRGWPSDPLTEDSEVLDGPPDADVEYGRLPTIGRGRTGTTADRRPGPNGRPPRHSVRSARSFCGPASSSAPASTSAVCRGGSPEQRVGAGCSLRGRLAGRSSRSTYVMWLRSPLTRQLSTGAGRTTSSHRSAGTP